MASITRLKKDVDSLTTLKANDPEYTIETIESIIENAQQLKKQVEYEMAENAKYPILPKIV